MVLPTPIPDKGRVLTQLSMFWFDKLRDVIPNHVISATDFPAELAGDRGHTRRPRHALPQDEADSHRMRGARIPCRLRMEGLSEDGPHLRHPACLLGLRESDRLPEPIFTPSTKATSGHDENISFEEAAARSGRELAERLRDVSLEIYRRAVAYAEPRGIMLADTKFEFGLDGDELIWIDEALTPDSSRFWPAAGYQPGHAQPSFDKQYVRDYLERIGWNKQPPGPSCPLTSSQKHGPNTGKLTFA